MKPAKPRDPLAAWHQLAAGSVAAKQMRKNLRRKKRKAEEALGKKVVLR